MAETTGPGDPPPDRFRTTTFDESQHRYKAIKVGSTGPHDSLANIHKSEHSVDLLHAIERDSCIADAIQVVEFCPGDGDAYLTIHRNPDWHPEWHGTIQSKANLTSLQRHPTDMVDLGLTQDEKSRWRTEIDVGNHSAAFAVLLAKLPNVRSLRLMGHGYLYKPYLDKVFKYACTNTDAPVLSKLEDAYISHWDTEGGEDLEVIDEIIFVPSLRKFGGHMLGSESGAANYQCAQTKTGDTRVSNIEDVDLSYSGIVHDDITEVIKPLTKLKSLDMSAYMEWAFLYMDEDGDVNDFRTGFETDAGHMLKGRDLVWKANADSLMIRKKGLNDGDFDDFDEGTEGEMKTSHSIEIMPDGTERHTVSILG